jgi:hypothetical protein
MLKLSKDKRNTLFVFIVGILCTMLLFFKGLSVADQTIINLVTILGTYVSIFGLFVAYIQILSVKKIAEFTEQKMQETKERINLILSVSDISKAVKITEEAQMFLKYKSYPLALLRLKDLKSVIIQASTIPGLNHFIETEHYQILKSKLFDDINNLSDFTSEHKKKINFSIINSDLEQISSILFEFENHLKK